VPEPTALPQILAFWALWHCRHARPPDVSLARWIRWLRPVRSRWCLFVCLRHRFAYRTGRADTERL